MTKMLVTGATGTIGGQVLSMLVEAGVDVRAAVRRPEAANLGDGVETVAYDIEAGTGVAEAFAGVERAFLLTPFVPGFEALTQRALDAAKAAGVRHVVKLSAAGADSKAASWLARSHGSGDDAAAASGMSHTILRPTFFQDNVLNYAASTIREQGTFYGASSGQPAAFISSRDVAGVAVQALVHPESHSGRIYDLTGGEAVTGEEVARMLSDATGHKITYTDLSPEQYAQGMRDAGTPEPYVEAFVWLEGVKAAGWAVAISPHVEEVLGRKPEAYAAFLARHRSMLPRPV